MLDKQQANGTGNKTMATRAGGITLAWPAGHPYNRLSLLLLSSLC